MRVLIFFVALLPWIAAHAADCPTALTATDTLKDLSEALKCMNGKIKSLESQISSSSASMSPPSPEKSAKASLQLNNSLQIELKKCGVSSNNSNNIYCEFDLTNMTKEDKKVCFGDGSRMVTDSGAAFSSSNCMYASVGSNTGSLCRGHNPVCDELTPLSKISGWIRFGDSAGKANGTVQFLRLDCGPGCKYETYNVPIK